MRVEGRTLEKIQKHLLHPDSEYLPQLTDFEQGKLVIYRTILSEVLQRPYRTDKELAAIIMDRFNVDRRTALTDIAFSKSLGSLYRPNKELMRYTSTQMLLEAYELAKAKGDAMAMASAADKLMKLHQLDKDDTLTDLYTKIVPPNYIFTTNPEDIGMVKVKPEIERELMERYVPDRIKDLTQKEDGTWS